MATPEEFCDAMEGPWIDMPRQQARVRAENDAALRRDLKAKFNLPDEFMDLAVRIWWDGKED